MSPLIAAILPGSGNGLLSPAALPYVNIPSLDLGFTQIQAFGILVAIGILWGFSIGRRRALRVGLDPEEMGMMSIWVILGGFVMAHIVSMVFYFPERLIEKPWEILFIWSGLSSTGGFLGSAIAAVLYAKIRKLNLLAYVDACAYGVIPGWVFGRLGCTVAHDHPGALSQFWLAIDYPGGARHDLGFYEFLFTILFIWPIFYMLGRKPRPDGFFVILFLLSYCPVRFVLDFLRASDVESSDPRYASLTAAQYLCIFGFAIGLTLLWLVLRHGKVRPWPQPPSPK